MGDFDLLNLAIDDDPEEMPTNLIGGRAAAPPPQAYRDAVRKSFEAYTSGDKANAVKRFMVPVKASEISWRTSERKDKAGKVVQTNKFQQHPNITSVITILRKAAEAEGLGVRIVVDYDKSADGQTLKVAKSGANAGTVRVRFVGIKRKQRKASAQTPTAA